MQAFNLLTCCNEIIWRIIYYVTQSEKCSVLECLSNDYVGTTTTEGTDQLENSSQFNNIC